MAEGNGQSGVEGARHRLPGATVNGPSGLLVPCPLGAIQYASDMVTVVCSDCGGEVVIDRPEPADQDDAFHSYMREVFGGDD